MSGRNLMGAKVIGVSPDKAQLPKYGDRPGWRMDKPGTLGGNTGAGVQLKEASRSRLHEPEVTWAKVQFHDLTDEKLLVVTPVNPPADLAQPPLDTYKVSWNEGSFIIRGLKPLVEAAHVVLRSDVTYELTTEIGEDEGGAVVWGSWTKATLVPRTVSTKTPGQGANPDEDEDDAPGDSEVAAGNQP